jgi:two-component system, NtrC family, response regulator AtoC
MATKKILLVDDDRLIRWSLRQKLGEWAHEVLEAETGADGVRFAGEESPDLILLDMKLPDGRGTDFLDEIRRSWPDLPIIMITAFGVIEDVVTAMRGGAYDFITKPFDDPKLQATIQRALEAAALKKKLSTYREIEQKKFAPGLFVGSTPVMVKLLAMAQRIAQSETAIILLQGESGTGKDLLAQSIHAWSRRHEAPFLAINCSAIPETLLESELFGYEKGAFTDAKSRKHGLVELADEGTLFLDEIDSLGPALQAKLLRFLETRTFKRVGGLKDVEVDIRVIAATNHDLEGLVREDKFRKDLFYRLNVCPLFLPPLAERKDDILPLVWHFIAVYNRKFKKSIRGLAAEAERLFLEYAWPGNVRELKNAVERAMIFEDGELITAEHLPFHPDGPAAAGPGGSAGLAAFGESLSLADAERRLIARALELADGNVSQAAKALGIGRDSLRYKLKKGTAGRPVEGLDKDESFK